MIILSVLQENLSEGEKVEENKQTNKASNKKMKARSNISGITIGTEDVVAEVADDVHTFLNFNVKMERFVINICSSSADDVSGLQEKEIITRT